MPSSLPYTLRLAPALFLTAALLGGPAPGLHGQEKRPLTLEDYGDWNRIAEVVLSADGDWLSYAYVPNDGDPTLFVRDLDGESLFETPNGADVVFSSNGRWAALLATPGEDEAESLREDGKPVPRTLHLIDLTDGARTEDSGVRSFAFSEDGRFLVVHRDRRDRDAEHEGSDLLLRDLQ
ncbi:MAG: hypothetical protein OEO23_16660, partial [Gemmatimonadota bacterium]|nr:hypothetical protein [Gemmatimonadota bacterium]